MRIALASSTFLLLAASGVWAAPAVPSGAHPRLFMGAEQRAAYAANAAKSGTSAASVVSDCQDTIDSPQWFTSRGGVDADTWPGAAVKCAFAYVVTQQSKYLTQAIKYWKAALEDDETIGDKLGCVQGVSTSWQTWAQNGGDTRPPILITVTHDTGYPMRWYGPFIALTYDWLHGAPGVDAALLAQTRTCLTAWVDWYSGYGYHHDEAGANYNAGFVIAKALAAVAIGNDAGADGHLWSEVVDDVFGKLLVGEGLAGSSSAVGTPAGVLVGGDWGEGWQYGPLSVLEYALAARVLEENGAALPAMDAWTNSLVVRYVHGTVPAMDGQWVGGDFDSDQPYQSPSSNQLDAVLLGPSSDKAASWAAYLKEQQQLGGGGYIYNALAETRVVVPADYRAQDPAPPLWYLARGTRVMYTRTSWGPDAFWAVFESAPAVVDDHHHMSATNFVFSRGADHLIVDPSFYGCRSTLPTNAITADATGVTGSYAPSQTPWSKAELLWARASADGVYGARGDIADAFIFADTPSTIPFARRDWVSLPEGEIVTIDRVRTGAETRKMYVDFYTLTGGKLALAAGTAGKTASGTVGGSKVVIHQVATSPAATPTIGKPPLDSGSCYDGTCTGVRLAVDQYALRVPGPYAVAIHAIDGLGAAEEPAIVGSLGDPAYDPDAQNGGVIGAAVFRASKQSYVVASSAEDGASGSTMTYGVPGASAGRHVIFDAPEAADGTSQVAAAVQGDRCVVTITAGSGSGLAGHPLMFQIGTAADGCAVSASTDVPAGTPPDGGGVPGVDGGGGGGGATGGCGCDAGGAPFAAWWLSALLATGFRRRRRGGPR